MPYTVRQAAIPALNRVKRAYEESFVAAGYNMAIQEIWRAYDWHWSISKLPPFGLVANQQDYGRPLFAVPSDYDKLTKAFYWDLSRDQVNPVCEINFLNSLPQSLVPQWPPQALCYLSAGLSSHGTGMFRVFPRPPQNISAPFHIIDGEYKRKYSYVLNGTTKYLMTPGDASAVDLPFEDKYFNVPVQALMWAFLSLDGSKDAGGVQMQNGIKSYYGQYAMMMSAIDQMAQEEAMLLGTVAMSPDRGLVDDFSAYGVSYGGW